MSYILILGGPVEGFAYIGPFDSEADAIEEAEGIGEEWWVTPLAPPDGPQEQPEAEED